MFSAMSFGSEALVLMFRVGSRSFGPWMLFIGSLRRLGLSLSFFSLGFAGLGYVACVFRRLFSAARILFITTRFTFSVRLSGGSFPWLKRGRS